MALLHFAVQETSRPGAQAAAERLLQLPPEALDGLSTDEVAQVQNFAVPADGISQLARCRRSPERLPVVRSRRISQRRLPVCRCGSRAAVCCSTGRSRPRRRRMVVSRSRRHSRAGTSRAIPADAFTLRADHPSLGALAASPAAEGDFAPERARRHSRTSSSATRDWRSGVVRLNGAPLAGATVAASGWSAARRGFQHANLHDWHLHVRVAAGGDLRADGDVGHRRE